jgi:hypothetical protein
MGQITRARERRRLAHFGFMVVVVPLVGGCAIQRAVVANQAQDKMIGLSKEEVLACMGPPANKMAEAATEVWSYGSGDGRTTTFSTARSRTTGDITRQPGGADFTANTRGTGTAVSTSRFCTVNVVMSEGRVSRVNYAGPTGGLLTQGEQCAFVVKNCVPEG